MAEEPVVKHGDHVLQVHCPTCHGNLNLTVGPQSPFKTWDDLRNGVVVQCEWCPEQYFARPILWRNR